MKVLFLASECVPFIKTGGLADVAGALPPYLHKQGADVRVMLPLYSAISSVWRTQLRHVADFSVQVGREKVYCGIEMLVYGDVTYYFVDNMHFFNREYVYGLGGDEFERFGFFCRAALDALPVINFRPDVIHCHDWQSGMVPALLEIQYRSQPFYADMHTVMTIHNLQYQGIFPLQETKQWFGLWDEDYTMDKLEYYGNACFLKAGLVYANLITTVSPSYAEEITTAFFGERMDGLLRSRRNCLKGVLNGIDVDEYNPQTDRLIAQNFSADNMEGKKACKAALQREMGLAEEADTPLVGMVTRLTGQKGLDLIERVLEDMMNTGIQLVLLGKGEAHYVDLFAYAESRWPGRVSARFEMNPDLAHRIYAGADLFLMPSMFEPCGLSQMIAMRYGTIPLVRETGGLRDTVLSLNEYTGEGNGFTFFNYNAHDMLHTLERALSYYRTNREVWNTLCRRGMEADFSWACSAGTYMALYEELCGRIVDNSPKSPQAVDENVEKQEIPVEKPVKARKKCTQTKVDKPVESEPKKRSTRKPKTETK